MSRREQADYLLDNYPIRSIAEALAEFMDSRTLPKINITPNQLETYFKIVGVSKVYFDKEFRGRKPVNPNPEDNMLFNNEEA